MELKTLVYIVVGLIWLVSKLLNANGKEKRSGKPVAEPMPVPVKPLPVPVKRKSIGRATPPASQSVIQPVSLESVEGLEKNINRERVRSKRKETPMETAIMHEVQILGEEQESAGSDFSARLVEEIKNGSFDWKRAVVINELMRQQHFR
ncbi:MAG: hypothetical protein JNL88_04810 [Bacteroidia bacterium]|nr:hypothetical protein [Bacteroidia bacterium]